MICKRCAIAGDLVAEARSINDSEILYIQDILEEVSTKEAVRSVAHLFHGLCKGCDCQHKVDFERKTIQ
jgi:hypothetical protein